MSECYQPPADRSARGAVMGGFIGLCLAALIALWFGIRPALFVVACIVAMLRVVVQGQ